MGEHSERRLQIENFGDIEAAAFADRLVCFWNREQGIIPLFRLFPNQLVTGSKAYTSSAIPVLSTARLQNPSFCSHNLDPFGQTT